MNVVTDGVKTTGESGNVTSPTVVIVCPARNEGGSKSMVMVVCARTETVVGKMEAAMMSTVPKNTSARLLDMRAHRHSILEISDTSDVKDGCYFELYTTAT